MEKIPYSRYTKEFREEAARLVLKDNLSVEEAAKRLYSYQAYLRATQ